MKTKYLMIILVILAISCGNNDNKNDFKYKGKVYLTEYLNEDRVKAESGVKMAEGLRTEQLFVNEKNGHFYIQIRRKGYGDKNVEIDLEWKGSGLTQISKFKIGEDSIDDIKHIETREFETVSGTHQVRHTYYSPFNELYIVYLIDYRDFIKF